jgi:membrane protease YdiL (CAAX protease family)
MRKRIWRWLEFLVLFIGIPLFIYLDKDFIHPSIIILPVLVFVFLVLRLRTPFQWKELGSWKVTKVTLGTHLAIFGAVSLLALYYVWGFDRENLFNLPRANPLIFLALCVFYPVVSAFGQEVIYRSFLYHRYRLIFPGIWPFVLASGLTFSFLHIVYYDPVSMILTLVGGLYFARVYLQTRSVLFTSVLHGLYGIMIFGVGLGQYFWLDIPI